MILIVIMYMLFASTFTIGKLALQYTDPIFFIGLRMALAGCMLLGYLWWNKQKVFILKTDWKKFIHIMLFHIYCAYVFEFIALQSIHSAKACLFYNFSPFITAALSYFAYNKRISLLQIFGLSIGFCGLMVLIVPHMQGEFYIIDKLFISWPELLMIFSVCSSAYGWIIFKDLVTQKNYSPLLINGVGMLGGGLLALATSLFIEGAPHVTQPPQLLFYTMLLILIANIIGYNMYGYLLKKYSVTFLSFAGFTTPLFAAFFGWLLLSESVTFHFFMSLGLVTVGLAIFYRDEKLNRRQ